MEQSFPSSPTNIQSLFSRDDESLNEITLVPEDYNVGDNNSLTEEEPDSTPLSSLYILNRFCLKVKEEALISSNAA